MLAGQRCSAHCHGVGGISLHNVMNIAGKNSVAHKRRKQLRQ
jgi:hypothetical protein